MPIYEYRCRSCGRITELIQGVNEPPATECGQCGGALEKLFSAPSFQFKGSGWYVTDYASKGASKSDGEDKGKSEKTSNAGGSQAATENSAAGDAAGT